MENSDAITDELLVTLTADIVAAHVSNNNVATGEVVDLVRTIHGALAGLGTSPEPVEQRPEPAVSIRASVKKDHLVCLEGGKKMKMLRRHLMSHHGMTPDEYRARWGLPADYPMVAADYADKPTSRSRSGSGVSQVKSGDGGGRAQINLHCSTPLLAPWRNFI